EPLELLLSRAVASIGRVELRVATLEGRRVGGGADLIDLVPAHARAPHPGVDLQVKGALPARRPLADRRRVAQHRRETESLELGEQRGLPGQDEEDGTGR